MAVMKMVALTMIGPHEEMEPVARQMVLTGGFQPLPIDFLVNDRSLRSKVTTESENPYDELLSKMTTIWKVAGEHLPDPEPITLDKDFNLFAARRTVGNTTGKLEAWNKRHDVLADELERLEATRSCVEALTNLHMSPGELAESKFAVPYFGRVSTDNFTRLTESTEDAPILAVELSRTRDNVWILVITVPGYIEGAKKLLETVYFKSFSLTEIANQLSREDPLGQITRSIELHKKSIHGLEEAAKNVLKSNRAEYETLFSRLYTMQRVYDLCKGRGEVSGMYVLSGWIPEDTFMNVKSTIEMEAPRTSIIAEQVKDIPYAGVRIPTMLRNNKLVQAFQDIVSIYSVPSYGEVDPSPFVAISFILFFGFMFGDVGHGVLLFLGTVLLQYKKILNRSLAYVMKCASCSSMVFGVLYGSIMGYEGVIPALWLSPMHDIGTLLSVAIVIGVLMISFGMILNMIIRYRERDFGRLLFDGQGLAGILMYWGAAGALYVSIAGVPLPFSVDYVWFALLGLFVITLFRDVLARTLLHQHTEKEPVVLQVFEVFHNLLNFFSNTLSFIRLGAFALCHVGLSLSVLLISDMVRHMPAGIVLKGLVLIFGNLLIVGLEGLIVFIQTLRLEYYEFFSKFYKGGGNVFKPVTWKKDKSVAQKS